jgi:ATP-dependent DNA helicase RecG
LKYGRNQDHSGFEDSGSGMSGQKVQDLDIEEVSSDRRNPTLADVMAQLDYMEKRGSGLKRFCNETRCLESYKEDRKPKFKSSSSHFITTIYSMEYDPAVTKKSSSSNQVEGLSNVLSRDQVEYLLTSMKQASPAAEIRKLMGMTNAGKFKKHYPDTPLFLSFYLVIKYLVIAQL